MKPIDKKAHLEKVYNAKFTPEAGIFFLDQRSLGGAYGHAIKITNILHHKRTFYQDIYILEAGRLGRMLILDGNINVCEFDEAAYHEMIAHVPLMTHQHPERVLVIGGGDGGTIREVVKHSCVKRIDLCEIDGEVIESCRSFMPFMAGGFDDPRVTIHVEDGSRFIKNVIERYDVIIVDGSDPDPGGPGEALFQRQFYEDLKRALNPGGVIVSQVESFYFYGSMLREMYSFLSELFPLAYYYMTSVPTYQSGIIGIAYCSSELAPLSALDSERLKNLKSLQYYTPGVHRAAFALPRKCLELLSPHLDHQAAL